VVKYRFTGYTVTKPNYSKPGSSKWSKDWAGYLTVHGTREVDGVHTHSTGGVQFSILRRGGGIKVERSLRSNEYNDPYSPVAVLDSNRGELTKAVQCLVDNQGLAELLVAQVLLVRTYNSTVVVDIRSK
jgi:hypothetical protein